MPQKRALLADAEMHIICREIHQACNRSFTIWSFHQGGAKKKTVVFRCFSYETTTPGKFLGSAGSEKLPTGLEWPASSQDLRKVADRLETWTEKRRSLLQESTGGVVKWWSEENHGEIWVFPIFKKLTNMNHMNIEATFFF